MSNKLSESIQMEIRDAAPCRKIFAFTVPADVLRDETDKTVREFAGAVALPGFRQGKAPINIVRTKYEAEIKEELNRRFFYAGYELIAKDEKLDILNCDLEGNPELKPGEEFKFELGADIAPEFELGDYNAIRVEVPAEAVADKDIDERIGFFRKMYGNYADVEGAAQAEDMLKVSYKSDFVLPEDATPALKRQVAADNTFLWLNEPENIPGCIAALTGAEKGKTVSFDAAYPADYREAALAGKTVRYDLTVDAIQRRAELSDAELAEKARVKDIAEFREMLKKSMEQENEAKHRQAVVEAVAEKVDALAKDFEFPASVLALETQRELQNLVSNIKTKEEADEFKNKLEDHRKTADAAARKALHRNFILRAIAKAEKITLDQAECDQQLGMMAHQYGYGEKEFRSMLEKNGRMDAFQLDLLNAKVLNYLADKAGKK